MKIVLFITLLETLALTLWMTRRWLSRNVRSRALLTPPVRPAANSLVVDRVSTPVDVPHWVFINDWQLEGQTDDRRPVVGSVADGPGRPSARRAFARRSHQVNYKEWTKERHD